MSKRVLLVGCTGMLAGMSKSFLDKGVDIFCLGRNKRRLSTLEEYAESSPGQAFCFQQDYTKQEEVLSLVSELMAQHGTFDAAVLWIHKTGDGLPELIAEMLASENQEVFIFHVLGSSYANPAANKTKRKLVHQASMRYVEVILGFVVESWGSRWLTNQEISQGTFLAFESAVLEDSPQDRFIIGQVEPWEDRP